jgi:hypothetical protein
MPINTSRLGLALSTIKKDEEGRYFSPSWFVKTHSHIRMNLIIGENFPRISSFMDFITMDIGNVETITTRLAWEKGLSQEKQLDFGKWMKYSGCDIDLFHIEMRSIFDYIAKIINRISDEPKRVPDKGFNNLKDWLKLECSEKTLGKDLADVVRSADWFDNLKTIRDESVHRGGMTLVFPDEKDILFQVYKGHENLVSIPEVMYNENVVRFESYAGLHFGYLIALLEDLAKIVEGRLPKGKSPFDCGKPVQFYGEELPIIYSWIEQLCQGQHKNEKLTS